MDADVRVIFQTLSSGQLSTLEIETMLDGYKNNPNFLDTLKEVNKKLIIELEEYYSEGAEAKEIIDNLVKSINICLRYIKDLSIKEVQRDIPVIFAPRTIDEAYFLSDLDTIPREQYDKVWQTLSSFIEGGCKYKGKIEQTDIDKYKKTYGRNQIRLYGYYLPGNMAFLSVLADTGITLFSNHDYHLPCFCVELYTLY